MDSANNHKKRNLCVIVEIISLLYIKNRLNHIIIVNHSDSKVYTSRLQFFTEP